MAKPTYLVPTLSFACETQGNVYPTIDGSVIHRNTAQAVEVK